MRFGFLLIAMVALSTAASPASAASPEDWDDCKGDDPDVSIAGCTRVLDAGDETPVLRGVAYSNRGLAYRDKADFTSAIADYTEAIRLDPNDPQIYATRGFAYRATGDFVSAVADLDKVVELAPQNSNAYLLRGLTRVLSGDPSGGEDDLRQALAYRPANSYAALWLDIALRRDGQDGELATAVDGIDMTAWPAPVIQYFLGQLSLTDLLAAAEDAEGAAKPARVCQAKFFAGELASIEGRAEDAQNLFGQAADACPVSMTESGGARAELQRVAGQGAIAADAPVEELVERPLASRGVAAPGAGDAAPGADPAIEIAYWTTVAQSSDPADFEAYLDRFPDGVFVPLARNRLAALSPTEAEPPGSALGKTELIKRIQTELSRLGCQPGVADGIWGQRSQRAVGRYAEQSDAALASPEPSQALLDRLSAEPATVCRTIAAIPAASGGGAGKVATAPQDWSCVALSVTVARLDPNGLLWDSPIQGNPEPDIVVSESNSGFKSSECRDSFTCNVRFRPAGNSLNLRIIDADVLKGDEQIGSGSCALGDKVCRLGLAQVTTQRCQ